MLTVAFPGLNPTSTAPPAVGKKPFESSVAPALRLIFTSVIASPCRLRSGFCHRVPDSTHRLFANVEFADPNTYSREDDRHDFLSTSYPALSYPVRTDEISGITDGILKRPDTDPLVFHTDTELEYYQFRSSLYLTNGFGEPIELPPTSEFICFRAFNTVETTRQISRARGEFARTSPTRTTTVQPSARC